MPESIPLPELRSVTVLVAIAPGEAAIETVRGADNFPGCAIPLTGMFTWGCFGSPLLMGSSWLAIPTTSGLNMTVRGTLDPGANE